jgi:hypothetical protein
MTTVRMINDTPNVARPTNRKVFGFIFYLSSYFSFSSVNRIHRSLDAYPLVPFVSTMPQSL